MHRCFHVPEILDLFCSAVLENNRYWLWDNRSGDLCSLARTCRAFHDPALDHLWHKLISISQLIKCMPPDLWKVETEGTWEKLTLERSIVPSDWSRLLRYAQRVHIFEPRYGDFKNTADYMAFSLAAGPRILFPNLRELTWGGTDDIVFSCMINLFLSPKIEKISISLNGSPVIRYSLLESLGVQHPSLTGVSLQDSSRDLYAISSVVKNWNQLQELSVPNLTLDALMHIATLPNLRTLDLTDMNEDPISQSLESCSSFFPSLRTLNIAPQNVELCMGVVRIATSSPFLGTLGITSRSATPPSVWARVYHTLQTHCNNSSLISLTLIDGAIDMGAGDNLGLINAHQVMPLLSFSNLTFIKLAPAGGIDLDNDLVKKMAKAWRSIETFTIDDSCLGLPPPKVTLLGLVPFAKFCPKLTHLTIFLNGTFDARPSRSICNESLKTLDVLRSPAESDGFDMSHMYYLASTASFLGDIFPNLFNINYYSYLNEGWKDIEDIVRAFSVTRERGRALGPCNTDNSDDDDNSGSSVN